jgi:putative peptide zinc metalloprotease protein
VAVAAVTEALFSASWYRVAALTPRLRGNATIRRHRYRGETWYVLGDQASDRLHRFSAAGHLVIGLMDGRRTVQAIWDAAAERLGDDAPTQDEMIRLLAQLHAADVLQCDVPPDTEELLRRRARHDTARRRARWMSPLSWKVPLVDPERLLQALAPLTRPCFGVVGLLLWLGVVAPALVLLAVHWRDFSAGFLDRLLAPQQAVILWLVFPVIKTLHELGHGLAVKAFGGEVHDMGVMLLVFTPVPYVDATSSAALPDKWRRITVAAAGMLVELFLAAVAVYVWVAAQPGLLRTVAYDVIVVAGLSTVLFNANPLLRYDGYYLLADLLEIPNLYRRSRAYLAYLGERYLFGRRDAEPPAAGAGERAWFVVYAVASATYRVLVVAAILAFLLDRAFYLGLVLAALSIGTWFAWPAARALAGLATSPRLRGVRVRAAVVTVAGIAAVIALVTAVPVPFRTQAEGVVWVPEDALVRAGTDGFIEQIVVRPGSRVRRGDVLVVCVDPELAARATVLEARQRELRARHDEQRVVDRVQAEIVREALEQAGRELARIRERQTALRLTAGADGVLVVAEADSLRGRFVRQGELVAYVVDLDRLTVRAVVPQDAVELVRGRLEGVEVRLTERLEAALPARLVRHVPGGSDRLPHPALGGEGGGTVAVDPRDAHGVTAVERIFQVDLELPAPAPLVNLGGRVHVRFDHGRAPLATQWYRELRQVFLARFNV